MNRRLIWWGRSEVGYSRNRMVRRLFADLGWDICDFRPRVPALGDAEAHLRGLPPAHLIWVPCFRQRDLAAALRFGRWAKLPVIADPLISAWDKQVFERGKFAAGSAAAERLRRWESRLLRACDAVMVDTPAHARFFAEALDIPAAKLHLLWVGAEQPLFTPRDQIVDHPAVEALFFGSFISLHGVDTVIAAARLTQHLSVRWTLLGTGPERAAAEEQAAGLGNVRFEDPVPYPDLPERIASADIVLGIFGTSGKAHRVIPNKVFQGMACGRPVVTGAGSGYPEACLHDGSGLVFVTSGDASALASAICRLAEQRPERTRLGAAAAETFSQTFGRSVVEGQLRSGLNAVGLT